MTAYTILRFIHVASDISLFIGIGAQLLTLVALRRTTTVEQVCAIVGLITITDWIGIIGSLLTIATGLYMALAVWGLNTGWISVALGSVALLIGPIIGGVVEPRTRRLVKMVKASPDGVLPDPLKARIEDPILGAALQTNLMIVLGVVFLMTTKPSLADSLLAMAVALTLGLASGLAMWRAPHKSYTR